MSLSPSATRRRRFCIALPAAVLAGATLTARARPVPVPESQWLQRSSGYEVALNLDLFGQASRPRIRAHPNQRIAVSGAHGAMPWRLEFTITPDRQSDQLHVATRLTSGDDVLAMPMRMVSPGQRVIVRADATMNVALLIKTV